MIFQQLNGKFTLETLYDIETNSGFDLRLEFIPKTCLLDMIISCRGLLAAVYDNKEIQLIQLPAQKVKSWRRDSATC